MCYVSQLVTSSRKTEHCLWEREREGENKCLKAESREWRTIWGPASPQTMPQGGWQKALGTHGAPVNLKGSLGSVMDAYVRMFSLGISVNIFT